MSRELGAKDSGGGHQRDSPVKQRTRIVPSSVGHLGCIEAEVVELGRASQEKPRVESRRALDWGHEAGGIHELIERRSQVVTAEHGSKGIPAQQGRLDSLQPGAVLGGERDTITPRSKKDAALLEQFAHGGNRMGRRVAPARDVVAQTHASSKRPHRTLDVASADKVTLVEGASGKRERVRREAAAARPAHHEHLDASPTADVADERESRSEASAGSSSGHRRTRVAATDRTAMMRAAVIHRFGGPDAVDLSLVPRCRPHEAEVVLQVAACGLNILDVLIRRGIAGVKVTLPHIGGCDIAGTVVDGRGADAERLIGERVLVQPSLDSGLIGQDRSGGLAEFVVVPSAAVIRVGVSDAHALYRYAALPVAYSTARRMLVSRAQLQPGDAVVIRGAGGGVGLACVQLARIIGARVIACTSSPQKLDRLRAFGVADALLTTNDEAGNRVRELTDGGADVVVDFLGRTTWRDSLRCARVGGRIVTCGSSTGHDADIDLRYVWARELTIVGSNGWVPEDLVRLVEMTDAGILEPVIHRMLPLARLAEAMAEIEERRAFGRVIVTPY